MKVSNLEKDGHVMLGVVGYGGGIWHSWYHHQSSFMYIASSFLINLCEHTHLSLSLLNTIIIPLQGLIVTSLWLVELL
jgi:thiamine biosynthesis protein ThiC